MKKNIILILLKKRTINIYVSNIVYIVLRKNTNIKIIKNYYKNTVLIV